jgi:hypothetical protein
MSSGASNQTRKGQPREGRACPNPLTDLLRRARTRSRDPVLRRWLRKLLQGNGGEVPAIPGTEAKAPNGRKGTRRCLKGSA